MLTPTAALGMVLSAPPASEANPPPEPIHPQAVQRIEPRVYDFWWEINFFDYSPSNEGIWLPPGPHTLDKPGTLSLPTLNAEMRQIRPSGAICMPAALQGPFHIADVETLRMSVRNRFGEISPLKVERDDDFLFQTTHAVAHLTDMPLEGMCWSIGYRIQVWNILFDETTAQRIGWPAEWPEEAKDGLGPQYAIPTGHEFFVNALTELGGDDWRDMPVHLAAKKIVLAVLSGVRSAPPIKVQYRSVQRPTGPDGELRWSGVRTYERDNCPALMLTGALNAARDGKGTPADIVAACVTMLRTAGIPARPVIGATEVEVEDLENIEAEQERLICWGEYYLPGNGWVPFDPQIMLESNLHVRKVTDAIPGFGGLPGLNQRIPFTYEVVPSESAQPALFRYFNAPEPPHATVNFRRTFVGGWGSRMEPAMLIPLWTYPWVEIEIKDVGPGTNDAGK